MLVNTGKDRRITYLPGGNRPGITAHFYAGSMFSEARLTKLMFFIQQVFGVSRVNVVNSYGRCKYACLKGDTLIIPIELLKLVMRLKRPFHETIGPPHFIPRDIEERTFGRGLVIALRGAIIRPDQSFHTEKDKAIILTRENTDF